MVGTARLRMLADMKGLELVNEAADEIDRLREAVKAAESCIANLYSMADTLLFREAEETMTQWRSTYAAVKEGL